MKKKNNCKHNFEVEDKQYDHWDNLESMVLFCNKCGECRKIEIEGNNVYVSKEEK